MIVFDDIDNWEPLLTDKLRPLIRPGVVDRVISAAPGYVEDACKVLLDNTTREAVINEAIEWVRSLTVAGYHGTRLTEAEARSVQTEGLIPMRADHRRSRLKRALSRHERWPEVADMLDDRLRAFGSGERAGRREGQVHLTLSHSGLVCGFNEYLTHGSEFDRQVAFDLLGNEGRELLANYGEPRVVVVAVPGDKALAAANSYWNVEERLARGEVPNLIDQFLCSWSYRLANPTFQSSSLQLDCGMIFYSTVPSDWIAGIEAPSLGGDTGQFA